MKSQADAANKMADTELKTAQIIETEADTMETLAKIEREGY